MKFSKKNILFKMMFVVLMTFICFNAHNVMAEDRNQCRYETSGYHFEFYFKDDNELKVKTNISYTKNTYAGMNGLILNTSKGLYCPSKVYFIRKNGSTVRMGSKEYVDKIKNGVWKDEKHIETEEVTLNLSESYNAYGYDLTKNPGVCIHTSNNTEFAGVYQMANNLKTATAYDDKYASKANQIDKYVKNNINKAFCDTEQFKVLQEAINNWNTVVSKDPSANKAQKDKAQEQAENTNKNIEEIISNIQNSTNISMPDDNPVQNTCEGLIDDDLKNIIDIVLNVVRVVVPILLIILTAVDFGQVVISNDKEAMPKAISKAIKRGIAAIVIFFIPFLVDLIIDWLNTYSGINGAANCIK